VDSDREQKAKVVDKWVDFGGGRLWCEWGTGFWVGSSVQAALQVDSCFGVNSWTGGDSDVLSTKRFKREELFARDQAGFLNILKARITQLANQFLLAG
jgi:hypothetical protein